MLSLPIKYEFKKQPHKQLFNNFIFKNKENFQNFINCLSITKKATPTKYDQKYNESENLLIGEKKLLINEKTFILLT
jgi:hypothetical protein